MNNIEYTKVLLSLDDEVFCNCMNELEPYLNNGWVTDEIENDDVMNISFITLKRQCVNQASNFVSA